MNSRQSLPKERLLNMTRRKVTSIILSMLTLFMLCVTLLPITTYAVDTVTSTVNIAIADKNMTGPGYYWANRTDTLTLSGLNIDTDEPYGLRLPKNCTVILEGKNTIKAAKYGISCSGTVVIKGSGSLTIEAGDIGIYLISQDNTQKVRLIEGKYEITAGTYGVYSEAADFSFVGDSMNINVGTPDGNAILGRSVNLLGGTFTANAPVESTHQLLVDGLNVNIEANRAAFSSKHMSVKDIDFGGTEYNGESVVSGKSTAKEVRTSILFGENVPGWVDYILLAVFAAGAASAIIGPALHRKKKTKELYERLEKEGYTVVK